MSAPLSDRAVTRMLSHASRRPWDGSGSPTTRPALCLALTEPGRLTSVLLTLDHGYHASGWWANADYDRCWHLSITHPLDETELVQVPGTLELVRRQRCEAPSDVEMQAWARRFFVDAARHAWIEPAAGVGDRYRLPNIAHVRVFLDPATGEPFTPTGEVYHLRPLDGLSPPKVIDGRLGADVR